MFLDLQVKKIIINTNAKLLCCFLSYFKKRFTSKTYELVLIILFQSIVIILMHFYDFKVIKETCLACWFFLTVHVNLFCLKLYLGL